MKLFIVPAGTPVRVIKKGKEWYSENFQGHVTKLENVFELEQMVIDPVANRGPNKNGVTVGGAYAKAGCYGFERDGYTLLVHASHVEVL